jgi:hypothetical protein
LLTIIPEIETQKTTKRRRHKVTHLRGTTPTDASRNCSAAYKIELTAMENSLRMLRANLKRHKELQAADPDNWGYTGDLEHLNNIIGDAWIALSGVNQEQLQRQILEEKRSGKKN